MITQEQLIDQLESLVDQSSVQAVLDALSDVCLAKSEHVRNYWTDEDLATRWERTGNRIATVSVKLGLHGAPGIN